ncbi:MAG: L,D-transpeptidase family protein [Patescibacteria group bacterium]|jgi:hypothetical protein
MKKIFFVSFLMIVLGLIIFPAITKAGNVISPQIKIFDSEGKLKTSFEVLGGNIYLGNTDLSLGDIDNDGKEEIIVSTGSGNSPRVEIWSDNGQKMGEFMAYAESFKGGVFISAGDIDGDGKSEIATGAGYRGGPQVRGFYGDGNNFFNFFSGDNNGRSGIKVLVVDLNGDNKSEIVTGSNLNQPAQIAVYDTQGKILKNKKLDFGNAGGVNLGKLPLFGSKEAILISPGYGNKPEVLILNSDLAETGRFAAFDDKYNGGINVSGGDLNGDGNSEIVVSPSFHGFAVVRVFDTKGTLLKEFKPYELDNYLGGIKNAVGDIDGDGKNEIVTLPERTFDSYRSGDYKFIDVDLKNQKLTYWQDGRKLDTFLISSGLASKPTPKGLFSIFKKRPKVNMVGTDYNLPNVPWVASFKGAYTIHGTYWHSNFGHVMSHGCVNMLTAQAKLIYDWVDIGTKVIIY